MPISPRNHAAVPEETEAPPVNEGLEREVLGHVLIEGRIPANLTRDIFHLQDHKKIFDAIDNMIAAGKIVNYISVNDALGNIPLGDRDGFDYLVDLKKDGLPGDIASFVEILNNLARRRKVITIGSLIEKAGLLGVREINDIIDNSIAKLQDLRTQESNEIAPTIAQWPDPLGPAAFHGLAGEFVQVLEPHTESDPVALLLQFLAGWGSAAGRGPYYLAEADRQPFDIVVDLFAGGGSTVDVCKKRFRRYWVSDRKPIVEREKEIRLHDVTVGLPKLARWQDVKLVYLDPPYWKQAEGKYSDDPEDLANMPLDQFTKTLAKLIVDFSKKLKPGAVIALMMQPTQWNTPDHERTDHIIDLVLAISAAKAPLKLDTRI